MQDTEDLDTVVKWPIEDEISLEPAHRPHADVGERQIGRLPEPSKLRKQNQQVARALHGLEEPPGRPGAKVSEMNEDFEQVVSRGAAFSHLWGHAFFPRRRGLNPPAR